MNDTPETEERVSCWHCKTVGQEIEMPGKPVAVDFGLPEFGLQYAVECDLCGCRGPAGSTPAIADCLWDNMNDHPREEELQDLLDQACQAQGDISAMLQAVETDRDELVTALEASQDRLRDYEAVQTLRHMNDGLNVHSSLVTIRRQIANNSTLLERIEDETDGGQEDS